MNGGPIASGVQRHRLSISAQNILEHWIEEGDLISMKIILEIAALKELSQMKEHLRIEDESHLKKILESLE